MSETFEPLLLGFATIFDAVLLLILLERINASQVAIWLKLLIAGTLIAHGASFLQASVIDLDDQNSSRLRQSMMFVTSAGLLLLPSAMLHAAVRLNHTGATAHPKPNIGYVVLYLPLLCLPWIAVLCARGDAGQFLDTLHPVVLPYLIWMISANLTCVVLFVRAREVMQVQGTPSFFIWHAMSLVLMTLLAIGYVFVDADLPVKAWLRLATVLSPFVPLSLFVWYALRTRLMTLVMERTIVYGAIFVGLFLAHRALIAPILRSAQPRSNFDLALVELVALLLVILVWQPLRRRVRESLRYLLSSNVFQVRDATRQLSLQLSKMGTKSPSAIVQEFKQSIQSAIAVEFVCIVFLDETSEHFVNGDSKTADHDLIGNTLVSGETSVIARGWQIEREVADAMGRLQAMWAFRLSSGTVQGLVVLGPRNRQDRLAGEQLTALSLLFEQFAVTLDNRALDEKRRLAELKAMQQEKLSILGLMAGSLAHELKNPLSSIRTIAALIKEESDPESHTYSDVSVITDEIDRLVVTTQRLLDYAKPANSIHESVQPDRVIERLFYILEHYAKQNQVAMEHCLHADASRVQATDAALSEILFNLIRNAIEACPLNASGRVRIKSEVLGTMLVITVEDNGSGMDSSVRESMFQPFVTAKPTGTGLGLYTAAQRVKELGGKLDCDTLQGRGTIFRLCLEVFVE
jgi:signal transduction histidine kinase